MLPMEGAKTAAFRLKALLLWLRAHRGSKEAQLFLRRVGCGRALENETKPIALLLWVRALAEFERSAGEEGFRTLSRFIAHPHNLGAWSPLLAQSHNPREAFAYLAAVQRDEQGSVWRVEKAQDRAWQGNAQLKLDLEPEDRRRVALALKAELESIPLLFALPKAKVKRQVTSEEPFSFFVEWHQTQAISWKASLTLVGALIVLALVLIEPLQFPFLEVLKSLAAVFVLGVLIVYFLIREAHQRRELKANRTRILALERASLLNQLKSHEASYPVEEPIVAGAYRVEEQLGTGAYASVWSARRLSDDTYVALKLLRSSVAHDPRATDRLRREAEALGMSWHPHVVEVLDHGLLGSGVAYLVMEQLKGESLRERIERHGTLSKLQAYELVFQAALGLNAAHRAGIIHRDIKPDHLFYHQKQSGELLKILDFGVAWVSWAELRLTREGTTVGTLGYAAPEQLKGELAAPSADLYSLGITLYQALTGVAPPISVAPPAEVSPPISHPYEYIGDQKSKPQQSGFRALAAKPKLPPQLASDVRELSAFRQEAADELRAFPSWIQFSKVEACWVPLLKGLTHYRPEKRYQTAAEFLAVLRHDVGSDEDTINSAAVASSLK